MDNVVQHLHRALAEALVQRRPDFEAAPVTVAEIYQELVPYRAVRGTVGFEMNADYEHALLRLLAGEGALVRLEPEEVRATLERELTTPNPDVTLFRRFAACDVWVSPPSDGWAPAGEAEDSGEAEEAAMEADDVSGQDWTPAWLEEATRGLEAPASLRPWMAEQDEPAPEVEDAPAPPLEAERAEAVQASESFEDVPPGAGAAERPAPRQAEAGRAAGAECAFCHGSLPTVRVVRFCPFCGVDQQLRPCARCGEVVEAGWRYCVSCGAPAAGA